MSCFFVRSTSGWTFWGERKHYSHNGAGRVESSRRRGLLWNKELSSCGSVWICVINLSQEAEEASWRKFYIKLTAGDCKIQTLLRLFGTLWKFACFLCNFRGKAAQTFSPHSLTVCHGVTELKRDLLWEVVRRPYLSVPLLTGDDRGAPASTWKRSCWRVVDTRRAFLDATASPGVGARVAPQTRTGPELHLIGVDTSRNQKGWKRSAICVSSTAPWKPQCHLTGIELTTSPADLVFFKPSLHTSIICIMESLWCSSYHHRAVIL